MLGDHVQTRATRCRATRGERLEVRTSHVHVGGMERKQMQMQVNARKVIVHIFHFIQDARSDGAPRSNWIIDTFPDLFPAMVFASGPTHRD